MEVLILLSFLFSPAIAKETKSVEMAYVQYKTKNKEHQYWIEKSSDGQMKLVFKDGKTLPKSKLIPKERAQLLAQNITRAYWDSQFKKPVKPFECTTYVRVRIPGEKTAPVCQQHGKASGWLYGSLMEMSRSVQ